jgi:hypothetical protein
MTVKTKADIQTLGGVFTDEEIVDDYRKRVMMEILPFLTSPMGCDLPMSLVLSCSPSLVLHDL